jgi:hypothetical protein
MIVECPRSIVGKDCYLRFVRGQNEVKTKKAVID